MLKKWFSILLVFVFALVMAAGCSSGGAGSSTPPAGTADPAASAGTESGAPAQSSPIDQLRLGTDAVGGTANVALEAMSSVVNRHTELRTSTIVTTGAVEIINLINSGELEGGYAGTINLVQALRGEAPFQGRIPESAMLQALGFVSWRLPILTIKGNGIESYEDLAGKRVAFPEVGSASAEVLRIVFEQYGIFDSARIEYFPWAEGFNALKDGRVDACVGTWGNGIPPAGIIELFTLRDINILSMNEEIARRIGEINSGIAAQELTYAENDTIPEGEGRLAPRNSGVVVFSASVSEEAVYVFTRACLENIEELGTISRDLAVLKDYATSVCVPDIPFHPGAARALKEAGLWQDNFIVYQG